MSERRVSRLRQALIGGVAIMALVTDAARAQQTDIFVPAQPLSQTLKDISRQTGDNILFTPESVAGLQAPQLSGKMTPEDAVARALSGTDLEAVSDGSGGLVIRKIAQKKTVVTGELPAETVIVTGSRIAQTSLTSPSPVAVVGRLEFLNSGATDVAKVINDLPSVFPSQNANLSNGATGTDNINLRDLGAQRNLILIDGSRLMPGDPTLPAGDINNIPTALIDRVEIMTGGASAVYGSDALAGAVNFILRRDFEGVEINGTYTITQNDNDTARWRNLIQEQIDIGVPGLSEPSTNVWNGQTEDATLILGTNSDNGKGNVTAYLGYRSMAALTEATREYSECALQPTATGDICQGSLNYNAWFSLDDNYAGAPNGGLYFQTGTGAPGSGRFVPLTFAPNQFYDFGATNYFQRPDTRYTGGFFAHYNIDRHLNLFADVMMMDDDTVAQIAPSGLFLGSGIGPDFTVYVNCSNPLMTPQENRLLCGLLPGDALTTINGRTFWNGAGNAPALTGNPDGVAGQANLEIGRRDIEGGNRQSELRHTSYRMKIGASGDVGAGWTYTIYAQEGYTQFSDISTGNYSTSRVQNALEVDPVTGQCYATEAGAALGCVPLDIFNGIGSITPAMRNYVAATAMTQGSTEEKIVSGSMTGDLGEWGVKSPWAQNAAKAVLGSEYRQEILAYLPDKEFQMGDVEGSGGPILAVPAAGFDVAEGFTELQLPLVQNVQAIEDLTLKGGYRFSAYSRAGDTDTWYGAAEWQPVDDVRFRASMQHAVRAPNVVELFTPDQISQFQSTYPESDPCATITTGQCANVPNAGTPLLNCPSLACNQQIGGNPMLKPESSNTRTVGVVLTPSFLDGFSATIDWWNIDVAHFISTIPAQEILDECYGAAATAQSEAFFCPFVHRSSNGTLYGPGFVASDAINTGYLKTSGVDFTVNYEADTQDWFGVNDGTLSFSALGTWLNTLVTDAVPATPFTQNVAVRSSYNCAGLFGQICGSPAAKWRHNLRVTWDSPFDVRFSLQWRFIGATALDADTSTPIIGGGPGLTHCSSFTVAGAGDCPDAHISSYSYFDVSAGWTVRSGVELRGGVNNIFDVEPPVLSQVAVPFTTGNGNTFTGGFDVLGRTLFVAATIKY
jgi:iron complex outermembrane receptor protein